MIQMRVICLFLCLAIHDIAVLAKQPHILLILADDYGWNDIGYHGSEIKTPTLDLLAKEGVKLENYYVQPICTPTRSQLLSGMYQIHTGLQHGIIWAEQPNCLPLDHPTIANKLQEVGYSTHAVGKWHLGFWKQECMPTNRGFDSHFGYLTGSEDYFSHRRTYNKSDSGIDFHHNMKPVSDYQGEYSAHVYVNHAKGIIHDHAINNTDKPLFLYMPFQSVHAPLEVPSKYEEQYSHIKNKARRTYAGMVSALDEAVKNITEFYKELGLWENTVLIFSTDNGGQVLEGGNNWPLRGWKGSLWEGGLHGNGFVHSNLLKTQGTINKELIHVSDWFPTVVNLGGGRLDGLELDGHDMWQTISKGTRSPRKELLHNIDPFTKPSGSPYPNGKFDSRIRAAIRVGPWKLITGNPGDSHWIPPPSADSVLRFSPKHNDLINYDKDLKYQAVNVIPNTGPSSKNVWLFNIEKDPTEHKDLSDENPTKVLELLARLAVYNSTAVPPYYPPNDPDSDPKLHGGFWMPWEKSITRKRINSIYNYQKWSKI